MADENNNLKPEEGKKENVFKRIGHGVKSLYHKVVDNPIAVAVGAALGSGLTVGAGLIVNAIRANNQTVNTDDVPELPEPTMEDDTND